ncbi:hypothetical protein CUU54_16755 [Pectobacterium polaris]|uniref:hypothetical protein n=1 Tax=Pectobacterium polaris TaxID=2042057 RepID=UPI000D615B79|nr:hypothetical protein [Pectobacterium polaris]MCU1790488.1 hypothetical protein [Pectobacterium polaris]PWD55380.1 hypothetical protein DF209_20000 [Pectobacterium polaris]
MSSILKKHGSDFLEKIVNLPLENKFILGLTYINRQSDLLILFDDRYDAGLHDAFCKYIQHGINSLIEKKPLAIDINEICKLIPHADDYSEIECTYVQNALLSLYYLFNFYLSQENNSFIKSLDMALENVDIIFYSENEPYDEESIFSHEINILHAIFSKIVNAPEGLSDLIHNEDKLSPL